MIISLEVKNIHDMLMLNTIIDLWKAKWKADEAEKEEKEPFAFTKKVAGDDHKEFVEFLTKAMEKTAKEEEDDGDAEDEPCHCDDESSEESADEAVAEAVSFFVDHQEVWEALSGLVKAMRDAGINGTVSFDRGDESRETDRG